MATAVAAKTPQGLSGLASAGSGWLKWLLPVALGLLLRIIPVPGGLTPSAWQSLLDPAQSWAGGQGLILFRNVPHAAVYTSVTSGYCD